MIEVTVKADDGRMCEVVLPNHKSLTPKAARAAVNGSYGVGTSALVSDGRRSYRVTPRTVRKTGVWW